MFLIDSKGVRAICRECRKLQEKCRHRNERVVRVKPRLTARARKYMSRPYADAV